MTGATTTTVEPVADAVGAGLGSAGGSAVGEIFDVAGSDVEPAAARRRIVRTDRALTDPRLAAAVRRYGRTAVRRALRDAQQEARRGAIPPEEVVRHTADLVELRGDGVRSVINATGVLLHTNLGRAVLSAPARRALERAAGSIDIEYDLESGRRDRRGRAALDALGAAVPAAGAVHVVNNNAAALILASAALAAGREVVISRGEMVEIGAGFRLTDLVAAAGARLVEVGTTNRTSLADYAAAVWSGTGFILKVHPSNYRIDGFTSQVDVGALAGLGAPVVVDIGSGLLGPEPVLPDEPDADTALRAGAALVTASGDKLLGGPQAGLLLGHREVITELRRHPLARAVRVDKLTLAALEATVRCPPTPTQQGLRATVAELRARAEMIVGRLAAADVSAAVVDTSAAIGGGGAPGVRLPSCAISVPQHLSRPLRRQPIAVVGRVRDGRLLLDMRSVPAELDDAVTAAVLRAATSPAGQPHDEPGRPAATVVDQR
ncbi:L-seryl-tRNA(Sec) selenium transferase [Solwaraspora sp. WMMD406]|uniref:L-seryl-tRNA(Sec) selenium transferase n=1 Tax=Solwaraspora sp. WMMD406 TaxID=3016095 RepID=UPI0024168DFA|nr:L-seryl-tRNA(Sec) selenium transferase [Solwaraspora sp. WMMD406]MDG4763971.1 L-seryl-tRNA(Sec) selenium transferase [Solwaraspora sp. WMMD406]